jgi:glycosyltransferase involved in cell wall biosynthesis
MFLPLVVAKNQRIGERDNVAAEPLPCPRARRGHNMTAMKSIPLGLSVVIPAYNSAETLAELVARLVRVLPGLTADYEVIFVNDGSRDDTWQVIQSLTAQHPFVRGINLMRNYGQHNALLCGIRAARYDRTITMDDDLQHPPEALPSLVAALRANIDVVYAAPAQAQHGIWRNLASFVTKLALRNSMDGNIAHRASAWRIFRTHLRSAFADYGSPYVSIDVLLTWGTTRFDAILLQHAPRARGQSNYTALSLLRHAVNMMTGFSTVPLRLANVVGLVFTVFGGLVLVYVVGRYLWQGSTVAGFPFLASIIAIFSGAQLFALGIIGEYIARMHGRLMERPSYVVETESA